MVGHLLEYHPAVVRLKELIDGEELGEPLLHLRQPPQPRQAARRRERAVEPRRARRLGRAAPDRRRARRVPRARAPRSCARASRTSSSATCASPPASSRTCTCRGSTPTRSGASRVVGSRRMATFDDMLIEGKLTIYDKGFDEDTRSWGEYIARSGDTFSPRIANVEPLRIECEHFVRVRAHGRDAPLGRPQRAARRARARGAAALARRRLGQTADADSRARRPPARSAPRGAPLRPRARGGARRRRTRGTARRAALGLQHWTQLPAHAPQDVRVAGRAVAQERPHQHQPVACDISTWSPDGAH